MSTLSVTTVTTGLSTTDLTLNTANTGAGDIVIQSDGLGIVLSGNSSTNTVDIAPNGHIAISNNSVNTFVLTSAGYVGLGTSTPGTTLDVNGNAFLRGLGAEGGELDLYNPDRTTIGMYLDVATADFGRLYQARDNSTMQIGQLVGTGGVLVLYTGATERMRISATGPVTIASNTLTLGTSSAAASPGWTYLPNGLKMVWGTVIANTISGATFTSAFPTACLSVSVTPITSGVYIGANTIYVSSVSASAASIRSASTTTTATAYYTAIGY